MTYRVVFAVTFSRYTLISSSLRSKTFGIGGLFEENNRKLFILLDLFSGPREILTQKE
jgi:hypothetical protein